MEHERKGMIHDYTGDGKGKTTAALGLAFRMVGSGAHVVMFQFLKNTESGELPASGAFGGKFEIIRAQHDFKEWVHELTDEQRDIVFEANRKLFEGALNAVINSKCDMVILDEIMFAMKTRIVSVEQVMDLISKKPAHMEIVLTGRDAPEELNGVADYVSFIRMVKHPYTRRRSARKGIEY